YIFTISKQRRFVKASPVQNVPLKITQAEKRAASLSGDACAHKHFSQSFPLGLRVFVPSCRL
ncbi:MAG: hypothetical protein IJU32_11885, partial [Pyramidobacter sp.]|nr:hypothetical protein [Pyramidobacter sp.]